jgi:hypothetical protein
MRVLSFIALFFVALQAGFGQTAASTAPGLSAGPGLPTDPRAVFAAAAPFYNFSNPTLKPWHLKASYQLYDEKGEPAEKGTYEYWWASPEVYRSTWTRGDSSHTDWHLREGKHASQAVGERFSYFENQLQVAFFSPLPNADELDPERDRIEMKPIKAGGAGLTCLMVIPLLQQKEQFKDVPLGLFATYCFDSQQPVLRSCYALSTVTMVFSKIVKVQDRYLGKEILFFEGSRKILFAAVDSITALQPDDPALKPPADVSVSDVEKVNVTDGLARGYLLKKVAPVYPQDAKSAHITGMVVLQATIGTDGGVHHLRVISAPLPSMVAASLWAASQWEYKPYLLNGAPVEVTANIKMVFMMSH